MNYWTQSEKNIYVAAHRGWWAKYPENTAEAFKAAAEIGVDQIETDVRLTKDGELICIHDATVDRTTDGTGEVKDFTFEEIRKLDAGIHMGEEFKGCKIPTFIEFMEIVKNYPNMTIDIEFKEYPVEGNEERAFYTCDKVLEIVEEYGFTDRCVVNAFHAGVHEYIRKKHGNKYKHHVFFPIRRMYGVNEDPYSYAYCACVGSWEKGQPLTKDVCEALKETPCKRVWAPDNLTADEVINMGAELITCKNPDEILRDLRAKGYHK